MFWSFLRKALIALRREIREVHQERKNNTPCNHHRIALRNRSDQLQSLVYLIPEVSARVLRVNCALQSQVYKIRTVIQNNNAGTYQDSNLPAKWDRNSTLRVLDKLCCKIKDLRLCLD